MGNCPPCGHHLRSYTGFVKCERANGLPPHCFFRVDRSKHVWAPIFIYAYPFNQAICIFAPSAGYTPTKCSILMTSPSNVTSPLVSPLICQKITVTMGSFGIHVDTPWPLWWPFVQHLIIPVPALAPIVKTWHHAGYYTRETST